VTERSERLLDILRFTDSREDEQDKQDQTNYVLRRLKTLLHRLGFEWKQIVRECIKSVTFPVQIRWTLFFGCWYFRFLTQPLTDCFLYFMDESFIYEGEGDPGSMVEPGAAHGKKIVFPELGTFRRIGLLGGLVMFWQRLPGETIKGDQEIKLLEDAADDPHNWFVTKRGGRYHVLRCARLPIRLAEPKRGREKERTCAKAGGGRAREYEWLKISEVVESYFRAICYSAVIDFCRRVTGSIIEV